jgi:hypothetical protein
MLICSERKYRCITSRTNTSHAKIKKWNAELIWLAKAPFFAPRPPARPPAPENPRPDPAAATRDGARDYVSSPPLPSRTLNRREGPPAGWPAAAARSWEGASCSERWTTIWGARDEIWIAQVTTCMGVWGRALSRVPEAPCANRASFFVDPI